MILHANTVAQNRAARVRAGRIHSDYSYGVILFTIAIKAREVIHQRALPCSGWSCKPKNSCLAAMRE